LLARNSRPGSSRRFPAAAAPFLVRRVGANEGLIADTSARDACQPPGAAASYTSLDSGMGIWRAGSGALRSLELALSMHAAARRLPGHRAGLHWRVSSADL